MSAPPNTAPTLGFWKIAEENRDRLAIVAPDYTEITYGEFYDLVNRISNGLAALGLKTGGCTNRSAPSTAASSGRSTLTATLRLCLRSSAR